MDGLVTVGTFFVRIEADLAKSLLDANGIQAMVAADDAGGMRPALLVGTGGARLMVRAEDAPRAAELLREVPSPRATPE